MSYQVKKALLAAIIPHTPGMSDARRKAIVERMTLVTPSYYQIDERGDFAGTLGATSIVDELNEVRKWEPDLFEPEKEAPTADAQGDHGHLSAGTLGESDEAAYYRGLSREEFQALSAGQKIRAANALSAPKVATRVVIPKAELVAHSGLSEKEYDALTFNERQRVLSEVEAIKFAAGDYSGSRRQ